MDFEKLEVWRLSARLSVDVYKYFSDCRDYGFKDQITRSSLSVPSNIAEGMSRGGDREKYHFLNVAKGSCSELRTQIYIGREVGLIPRALSQDWVGRCKRISSMLTGLQRQIGRTTE
ncbi:four helix bundle protein [Halopseudomonas maritima]|uniref:four helix bundle protein n=1 Tax=Halopseudomonas maritima TaxID=2918528 RepID=UPI001EE9F415|nr:four helix bundle protein [Halopseudomonas maritima]UJJ30654.1 four helix bundle protein [Halopseudomonas maritima]